MMLKSVGRKNEIKDNRAEAAKMAKAKAVWDLNVFVVSGFPDQYSKTDEQGHI